MNYTPSFKAITKTPQVFTTNNPRGEDRKSIAVTIVDITFNDITRSIEVTCSDNRKRQCRIDRLANDKTIKELEKTLTTAYSKAQPVHFIAAGGNDPNVWFYTLTTKGE
jgi:hypothetical protein